MSINFSLYLFLFVLSLGMSLLFTYIVMQFARKKKIFAKPVGRSVHSKPVPYLGGLAIYASFILTLIFACFLDPSIRSVFSFKFQGLLIAASIVVMLGMIDDLRPIEPQLKLFGQSLAAIVLYMYGFRIEVLSHPFSSHVIHFPMVIGLLITFAWFLGVMNAINLIDGLDGLAAGITVIVSFSLFFPALYLNSYATLFLLVTLGGATLGFLPYNYYPARIFMGDTGSMFIGLILGSIALLETQYKATTAIALLVPFVALAIPIMDEFLAIVRRIMGKKSVFSADKKHLHHRLLAAGVKHKHIVLFLYLATLYLGLFAFLFVLIPEKYSFVLLILLTMGAYMSVTTLDFFEKKMRYQYKLGQRRSKASAAKRIKKG